MLKRIYWAIKVHFFPHLERRTKNAPPKYLEMRKPLLGKMNDADDMLSTAIMDLRDAIEGKEK